MRVFLIGFMGSGKSHTSRTLAALLGAPFIDLDEWLEIKHGRTINEFFRAEGEAAFRQAESDMLRQLTTLPAFVMATGGGAPCHHDNINWMKDHGLVIYLDTPTDILVERLKGEARERPLIKDIPPDGLADFINNKLAERIAYYREAHVIYRLERADEDVAANLYRQYFHSAVY